MDEDCGFIKSNKLTPKNTMEDEACLELPLKNNKTCVCCKSFLIDREIETTFNKLICKDCKWKKLEFITKTTSREEYLLTLEELNNFKFLTRPNPHKGTWNDMNLYLKEEIESFAISKYESLENIAKMREDRKKNKFEKKKKKFKEKVRDLKRKTILKTDDTSEKHIHNFIQKNKGVAVCSCGLQIEQEEI